MLADSADDMMELGARFAREALPGSVFALMGDLGAGKTHWTKGFVHGLGCPAEVTSPTFGLLHEYPGGRMPVRHLDFYRMSSADEVLALGWDEMLEEGGILIAEWADLFPALFPGHARWLRFSIAADGSRSVFEVTAPE